MDENKTPRVFELFHPASVLIMAFVNGMGIVIILATYILHHNLLGLNLFEALVIWFVAQYVVIRIMIG
jgi:hypothetical protein